MINAEATQELQSLLDEPLNVDLAMDLIDKKADPNVRSLKNGKSLLHLLSKKENNPNGKNDAAIEKLVNVYKAEVDIKDDSGYTPLQYIISGTFHSKAAMKLVELGANPDAPAISNGKRLLHVLTRKMNNVNGKNDELIEKLVTVYHADLNLPDQKGFTPVQYLLDDLSTLNAALKLMRLGADPDSPSASEGKTLSILLKENKLDKAHLKIMDEIDTLARQYSKKHYSSLRSGFLSLLFILSCDRKNKGSESFFKYLPLEIVAVIASHLDFNKMGKTQAECFDLAYHVLSNPAQIKTMARSPGGINLFQRAQAETGRSTFQFFKSCTRLCEDYKDLKIHLKKTQKRRYPLWDAITGKEFTATSTKVLDKTKEHALPYWHEHASLYKKEASIQRLADNIKEEGPYQNPDIQSQLKIKK